jgi:collagen type VII alpha
MNRTLGLALSGLFTLGIVSLACSSGEVVEGPPGEGGATATTGAAGMTGGGPAGSPGPGKGGTTGAAGSPGGVAGSPATSKGGSTGTGKGGTTGAAGSPGSKGGSTGTGNTTGAAGTTGTGNSTGTGNASGATTCVMGLSTAPQYALITDFSDAVDDGTGEIKFGSSAQSAQGGTSRFASGTKGTLAVTAGALKFTGMVEAPTTANMYPYNGFSLYVNGPGCMDASSYTGITFKISGLTGTCTLEFGFSDSAHTLMSSDRDRGSAASGAYAAGYAVTAATTGVNFGTAPTSPGSPTTAVDPMKLIGIQFQFKPASSTATTACTGSFTLDDVKLTH